MEKKIYNHGFYDHYYKCQECGCESISLKHLGGFQPADLICDQCGTKVTNTKIQIEKSDREKAIEWWNDHSKLQQTQLCDTNTEIVGNIRRRETLTGSEIEQIWRKETQQKIEEKKQVDFGLLQRTVQMVSNYNNIEEIEFTKKENDNLKLFFELLSKSSTFAHKELNKLNNQ